MHMAEYYYSTTDGALDDGEDSVDERSADSQGEGYLLLVYRAHVEHDDGAHGEGDDSLYGERLALKF